MPLRCGRKNSVMTSRGSSARRAWTPFNCARTNLTRRPWANFSRTGKNGGCEDENERRIYGSTRVSRVGFGVPPKPLCRTDSRRVGRDVRRPARRGCYPQQTAMITNSAASRRQRHPRHQAAGGHSERLGMAVVDAGRTGRGGVVLRLALVAEAAGADSGRAAGAGPRSREGKTGEALALIAQPKPFCIPGLRHGSHLSRRAV